MINELPKGSYCVHDQVWLHNPVVPHGSSRKLHCPWQGPFKIVKGIGNVLYKIQNEKKLKKCRVVHFNQLKPFRQRPEPLTPPMPLVPRWSILSEECESDTSELESTIASSDSEDNSVDQADSPMRSSTTENSNPDDEEVTEQPEPAPVLRCSTRHRRRPDWYGNVVTMQTSESELDD